MSAPFTRCHEGRHVNLTARSLGVAGRGISRTTEACLRGRRLRWAQVVEVKGSYDQWRSVRRLERRARDGTWAITAYLPPGVYQVRAAVLCALTTARQERAPNHQMWQQLHIAQPCVEQWALCSVLAILASPPLCC